MKRKQQNQEIGFGSDSFLDILANLVGILIILIVMAGVKVSKAPILFTQSEEMPKETVNPRRISRQTEIPSGITEGQKLLSESSRLRDHSLENTLQNGTTFSDVFPLHQPLLRESESQQTVDKRLVEEQTQALKQLEFELSQIEQDSRKLYERRKLTSDASILLKTRYRSQLTSRKQIQQLYDARQKEILKADQNLKALSELRANLEQQESKLMQQHQTGETLGLKHVVTPMSQLVEGAELHFHLSENKVSYVPIPGLLELLKYELSEHKKWLLKTQGQQGTVGPIGGFRMRYLMEVDTHSALSPLNRAKGSIRLELRKWELQPEEKFSGETFQQAKQTRSRFSRKLQTASPGSTLTFWVYPDSYDLFRTLQQFAHGQGFRVAARPLPTGVLISGSPEGSRSLGQ